MAVNRMPARVVAAFFALTAWQCGSETTGVLDGLSDRETGTGRADSTYLYAGYDSSGREIVRGELVVIADDSGDVTGSWNFTAVGTPPPMIGPQVGAGSLVGRIVYSSFGVNLNPDMADNNVVLLGTIDADRITGIWEFIGFPGVLNHGTFSAVRKR